MRVVAFVLILVFCYVECRKIYKPIDKNANLDFINMEGGGVKPSPGNVGPAATLTPASKVSAPQPTLKPVAPEPVKPTPASVKPAQPIQPTKIPNQITPKPAYPAPAVTPITTPGPGSVKQLVTFYDSQGKASLIRPYSYSQAVKQG